MDKILVQVKLLFGSRKFWALLVAIAAIAGGYATGQVSVWESLQALIAALAVYSTGIAFVDAGYAGKAQQNPETYPVKSEEPTPSLTPAGAPRASLLPSGSAKREGRGE